MPSQQFQQWFSQFTTNSPFLFAILDEQHNYQMVNERYEHIAGLSMNELIGMNDNKVLGTSFYSLLKPYYQRALIGEHIQSEITLTHGNNETALAFSVSPLMRDEHVKHIIFHAHDVSEKKVLSRSLTDVELQFHTLADLIPDGMLLIENGIITSANNAALKQLKYSHINELLGQNIKSLFIDPKSNGALTIPDYISKPLHVSTSTLCPINAQFELHIQNLHISNSHTYIALIKPYQAPIATLKKTLINDHNHLDNLTKQFNRFGFCKQLDKCIKTHQHLVLLYIDIDNFKNINDSLGHNIGDNVLKEVASRLHDLLPNRAILGHLGGDEFAMIITENVHNTTLATQTSEELAQKIIDVINQPFDLLHFSKKLACSIGSVRYPSGGSDARMLLQNADTAMFEAKDRGRNRLIHFNDKMSQEARMRLWLEIELQKALQQDSLEVWYQPKVNARDFTINGAEALVRWKHPIEGYISPGSFIPVAEKSGLIEHLGQVVMKEVFTTVKKWKDQGILPGRVAINLSPEQFGNPNLLHYVKKLIKTTQVDPLNITFELTESAVMSDNQHTLQMLNGIKKLGFALSIDDFGTGYSSLAYLARFPLDELKIDRSFIMEIDALPKQITVIENIINLGKSLNLSIVAEGVETHQQASLLSNLRCHSIQGFHFYKPQPKQDVEILFTQNRHHKN